jgi:hypothetical protein
MRVLMRVAHNRSMIDSIAKVATERPERYLKQLVSHLGNKVETEMTEDGRSGSLTFTSGTCELAAEPGTLVMTAQAEDIELLARVQDVVARHLVRFGTKDELVVEWSEPVKL